VIDATRDDILSGISREEINQMVTLIARLNLHDAEKTDAWASVFLFLAML
jgi:type III secretory pathway lipoprotein EscJ